MSPEEVKDCSFLEITRMFDEYNDMMDVDDKNKEEKPLPTGTYQL